MVLTRHQRLGPGRLLALGAAAAGTYAFLLRPWHQRWGSTPDELGQPMPGDEEVPNPLLHATRAMTIEAPASVVWRWLVQIGYGRAGFYGYDAVDNGGKKSADRIIPEYQRLEVGDIVPTGPDQGLRVAALEPERSLLLVRNDPGLHASCSVVIRELEAARCRLVVRIKAWFGLGLREALSFLAFDPASFLLLRKQMLGLKERAEREYEPLRFKNAREPAPAEPLPS